MPAQRAQSESGFTLIEVVLSVMIVSIAAAGTLLVAFQVSRGSADPVIYHQANILAEAYLDEILLKPFCDPAGAGLGTVCETSAPYAQEPNRAEFDNVCDYHDVNDQPPRNQLTSTMAPGGVLDEYRVQVFVDPNSPSADLGTGVGLLRGSLNEILRVDVEVRHPHLARPVTISSYRANHDACP